MLEAIQAAVLPQAVYEMPYLDDGHVATHAATEAGRDDARQASIDTLTRDPRMPHQHTVLSHVMELLEIVGLRAYAILAALEAGTLTPRFIPSPATKGWKAASLRTKVLVAVAFVLEAVFGARMAERLAGSDDYISWAVGLAIAAVLTMGALSISHAIHTKMPGLMLGAGAGLALGVAVVATAFLAVYAWGLGGGAEARPTIGGLSGGNPAGQVRGVGGAPENWALVVVYGALLLLLLTSVMLSHMLDLFHEDVARVDKDVASKARVLASEDQIVLAIDLLRRTLVLNDQAKHRARGLLGAYIGGARSMLPPAINSAWDSSDLEQVEIPDPTWVGEVEAEIRRLQGEPGHTDR